MKTIIKRKHYLECNAPICAGYPVDGLVWYPGEVICTKTPYKKWQRTQKKLAKLEKDNPGMTDTFYTVEMLEGMQRIRKGVKGKNPQKKQEITSTRDAWISPEVATVHFEV